jgi:hypothetical protein
MRPVMSSTLAKSWARTLPSGIRVPPGVQGAGRVDRCGPHFVSHLVSHHVWTHPDRRGSLLTNTLVRHPSWTWLDGFPSTRLPGLDEYVDARS